MRVLLNLIQLEMCTHTHTHIHTHAHTHISPTATNADPLQAKTAPLEYLSLPVMVTEQRLIGSVQVPPVNSRPDEDERTIVEVKKEIKIAVALHIGGAHTWHCHSIRHMHGYVI